MWESYLTMVAEVKIQKYFQKISTSVLIVKMTTSNFYLVYFLYIMRLDDHPYLGCNDDAIRRKTFVRVSVHCLLAFFLSFFRFFSFLMSVFVALQESSRVCVCVCLFMPWTVPIV